MNNISPKSVLERESGMSDVRISFYKETIDRWVMDKNVNILVVGGGETDRDMLAELEFINVIISNLDSRLLGDEFKPYEWDYQDAENLTYRDNEFDFVIVHAALHHCRSPHRALLEMYRVAKTSLIAFESRDSLLMSFLEKTNITPSYEHIAVYCNNGQFGGVNNSNIPNYIFRWTEREIEKTINTYCPQAKHLFAYNYGNDIPFGTELEKDGGLKQAIIQIAKPFYKIFVKLFKKQQNLFAFRVDKPNFSTDLQEWLEVDGDNLKFSNEWANKFYKY